MLEAFDRLWTLLVYSDGGRWSVVLFALGCVLLGVRAWRHDDLMRPPLYQGCATALVLLGLFVFFETDVARRFGVLWAFIGAVPIAFMAAVLAVLVGLCSRLLIELGVTIAIWLRVPQSDAMWNDPQVWVRVGEFLKKNFKDRT